MSAHAFGGSAEEASWHKKPATLHPPTDQALIVEGQRYPFREERPMTNHTPGPWRRFGGMVDGYGITSPTEVVLPQASFNGLGHKANASLIASAPDLLATLELVKAALASYLSGDWDGNDEGWQCTLDNVNKAIAKARGKA
jgi:hypothetical protein